MKNIRLIARLDVKGENLIKGIHLEGLRKIGNPNEYALKYYRQGIDEIIYMDIVASLYNRNSLLDVVEETTKSVFVPITVGGGIRSLHDVEMALKAGADKVAVNTAAIKNPGLISEIAKRFGSQCMVLSIEAIKTEKDKWEAFFDNGRERTEMDAIAWAHQGVELGAGEILLTSIDQEGTAKGFDLELTRAVASSVSVPVISSGGMGEVQHLEDVIKQGEADAVAMAHVLHYNKLTIPQIRESACQRSLNVRGCQG